MHFYKLLQGFALLCLSVLIISCGGGGAGASSGGGTTLPVLRTQSGTVTNGALTLTDSVTGASITVPQGQLQTGTKLSLNVKQGVPTSLNGMPITTIQNTYSVSMQNVAMPTAPPLSIAVTVPIPSSMSAGAQVFVVSFLDTANLDSPSSDLGTISTDGKSVTAQLSYGAFKTAEQHSNGASTIELNFTVAAITTTSSDSLQRGLKQPSVFLYDKPSNSDLQTTSHIPVSGKRICVLIHGLTQSATNSDVVQAAGYLAQVQIGNTNSPASLYDDVFAIDYDTGQSIHDNAEKVAALLAPYLGECSSCDIVGYSMGGLIARWGIEKSTYNLAQYSSKLRLITLGTPHYGVPMKGYFTFVKIFGKLPGIQELVQWPAGKAPSFDFINTLDGNILPNNINYYTLAGTNPNYALTLGLLSDVYSQLADDLTIPSSDNDGVVGEYSGNWSSLAQISSSWGVKLNAQYEDVYQTHGSILNLALSSTQVNSYLLKNVQVTIN